MVVFVSILNAGDESGGGRDLAVIAGLVDVLMVGGFGVLKLDESSFTLAEVFFCIGSLRVEFQIYSNNLRVCVSQLTLSEK